MLNLFPHQQVIANTLLLVFIAFSLVLELPFVLIVEPLMLLTDKLLLMFTVLLVSQPLEELSSV